MLKNNQWKLFIVQNETVSSKIVEVPEGQTADNFINGVIEALKNINDLPDLKYVLFANHQDWCVYYNFEVNYSNPIKILSRTINEIPNTGLIKTVKFSDKFITSEKVTNMDFVETDLFQGFPELKTMQIREESDVKKFVDFVINKLDVNFNPDDPFENFFEAGETKTFQGIVCVITQEDLDFLNATVETCAAITGDEFYDISLEILNKRLGGIFTEEGAQLTKEPLKVGSTYVLDDFITGNHINFPERDDFRPGTKLVIQKIPKNRDSIIAYEVDFEDDSYSFSKEEFLEKTQLSV